MIINSDICEQRVRPMKCRIMLWKKANLPKLMTHSKLFSKEFINKFNVSSPVEEMWSLFKTTLIGLQDQHVPSKTASTQHHQHWVTTTVKIMSRKKKLAFKRMKTSGESIDQETYWHVQKVSASCCPGAHSSCLNCLLDPSEDINNKSFWSF